MIVERGRGSEVIVRYRDEKGYRVEKRLGKGMKPYCFVKEKEAWKARGTKIEGGYTGLYGEKLSRVEFENEAYLRQAREDMDTWEANIPWEARVLVDSGWECPEYEERVWFLDMEWKMDSGEITIVVVRDSLEGEFVWFTHPDVEPGKYTSLPCKDHPYGQKEVVSGDRPFKCMANEAEMLNDVARLMRGHDPDIITGWNVVNADVQQLLKRMGSAATKLSPMGRVRWDFKDWAQPIIGRKVLDLMVGFKKLWTIKNGQLPGMSLDAVSQFCLGEQKVPLKDGHDTYYTDIGTYLDYARQDVALLPRLNDLVDVLGYHTALQRIVGCPLRMTPFITQMFSVLCLRDEDFNLRIPSSPRFAKEDYQGADIMDPEPGVYSNIGIFDVRAMYHSNVAKYGICWTTLSEDGEDCGNGIKFDRSKKGLLCRQMDKMTDLRNEYKAKMKAAETPDLRRRYDVLQNATKHLVASMYGVAGDSKFGMYHPNIAAAITFTSRQTLGELRDHAEDLGFKVRYGHTDSIMAEVPSPEEGLAALAEINRRMSPIVTEFEKWSSRFLVLAKNRYCGLVEWTDGDFHEPERYVKGIEMKQSRLPRAMKNAMGLVIDGILSGQTEAEVTEDLRSLIDDVVSKRMSVRDVSMRGKLTNDLSRYAVLSEARAAAKWANDNLGKGYGKGDYFDVVLDSHGNYIAFDEPSDIEGIAEVGYQHIARKFVYEKVKPYYEVMGWNYMPLENALSGVGDLNWL
jgi:DNA polymerase elongation subunit (family B)